MWSALRSDLREFVSSVAEESTSALAAIDSQLSAAAPQEEQQQDSDVILNDDGNITYLPKDEEEHKNVEELINKLEKEKNTYIVELTEEEEEQWKNVEEESLVSKEETFKEKPHVEEKYKEIVLEGSDTTEDMFWSRYYVRCYLPSQKKPTSESEGIMSGLLKFMEGAAKTLDHHRPPFVLNTAVDEDDEFGWGSEEEDDDEYVEEQPDESKLTVNEENEKINEIEKFYKNKLAEVEEERNLLHQTIELQRNEIADLNATVQSLKATLEEKEKILQKSQDEPSSASSGVIHVESNEEAIESTKVGEEDEEDDWGDDAWGDQ